MKPVLSGLSLVAAFLGGMALESARGKTTRVVEESRLCPPALAPNVTAAVADLAPLRAEIRALRNELAEQREPAAASPAAAAPAEPPQGDPQAFGEAQQLITAAHASRRWRHEDVLAVRGLLGRMSPAEREGVMSSLFTAINTGAIQLDDDVVRSPI